MITVDPHAAEPPYEQIRAGIIARIDEGALRPGDRLPTVRQLAQDVGVAANTVARAYRELEETGHIDTRGRSGSFVAGRGVDAEARAAARAYVDRVRELGLDPADALELVRRLLDVRQPES
jgi:DNA-binding transcriptional regulator YhcF (GntR family)